MATSNSTNLEPTWTDPNDCPFCGAALTDPGSGFIDHIDEHADCARGFETWREGVAGDMAGEWMS